MLYKLLFFPARIALYLYCRRIRVNRKALLRQQGPLLIAANHPNSFLDAVLISSLFRFPVYSLARGDVFAGKTINRILESLNMLPVYRVSEGAENLGLNYTTFDACRKLFEHHKIILIFSEGRCINEWHLRPLKKGTARLAFSAWENNVDLRVLPLGLNYSSFRYFGKNMILNFGDIMSKEDFQNGGGQGKSIREFNDALQAQFEKLVYEIKPGDREKQKAYFFIRQPVLKKILLFLPALAGFLIHAPLYGTVHLCIKNRALDHYDSIMTGILFFLFPLWVLVITGIVLSATGSAYSLLLLALLPFAAWSYLQLRKQIP